MPSNAWTPLANITLGSSASSVTFSSISQDYKDLVLIINGTSQAGGDVWYRFNSDSGSNYPYVNMYGTGTSATAGSGTTNKGVLNYNNTTSIFNIIANIMDYSVTDKHKTVISRGNQADGFVMSYLTRWANTAAVTTLQVSLDGTNFFSGTTISLYGVKA